MNPITTPVEEHRGILVKREDLCTVGTAAPPFSKMRGVIEHIRNRPEDTIGVLDTFHSQGGHAVAYACHLLGKRCLNYWPMYKSRMFHPLQPQQKAAFDLGAELIALPAARSAILYHTAKARTLERGGYIMPNALKLPETVATTAREVMNTPEVATVRNVVVSISSGTIAAGVLAGLRYARWHGILTLHMGYSRSLKAVLEYLDWMAGSTRNWPHVEVRVVDEGYAYQDSVESTAPFPSNAYYDAKAWRWLEANPLPDAMFWNIG